MFTTALVLIVIGSVALAPAVARRLGTRRVVAGLLLFGFGLVIAATLLPDRDALAGIASERVCDMSRFGPASIAELTRVNTTSLNVLLFVPLGVAVGLLPRSRTTTFVVVAAVSLTFVVEAIQLFVTVLGRGCQTADMVDNLMGLAIGIAIGVLARPVLARVSV
jgi:hypothetical protein